MRDLTFLDPDDKDVSAQAEKSGFFVAHIILAAAYLIAAIQGIYVTRRKHYLYERYSLRYFFPWASIVQILENATLAVDVHENSDPPSALNSVVYALQTTVAPCLLLSTFDVTYSIHKTRHIPFCGVYDGQTHTKRPCFTFSLKTCMRILALCLLALGIIVNFNLIEPTTSPYAGRAGWYWVITEPWKPENIHVVLALIPDAILSLVNFYFSMTLWRYGTSYSMVVHSTPINPWFSPFFGNLALFAGQWFGPRWYPLLSNLAMFIFLESFLLLFSEVNKDMQAATELRDFLSAIGDKRSEQNRQSRDEETGTPIQTGNDTVASQVASEDEVLKEKEETKEALDEVVKEEATKDVKDEGDRENVGTEEAVEHAEDKVNEEQVVTKEPLGEGDRETKEVVDAKDTDENEPTESKVVEQPVEVPFVGDVAKEEEEERIYSRRTKREKR
jgi:hypothetical protein